MYARVRRSLFQPRHGCTNDGWRQPCVRLSLPRGGRLRGRSQAEQLLIAAAVIVAPLASFVVGFVVVVVVDVGLLRAVFGHDRRRDLLGVVTVELLRFLPASVPRGQDVDEMYAEVAVQQRVQVRIQTRVEIRERMGDRSDGVENGRMRVDQGVELQWTGALQQLENVDGQPADCERRRDDDHLKGRSSVRR